LLLAARPPRKSPTCSRLASSPPRSSASRRFSFGVGLHLIKLRVRDTTLRLAFFLPSSYVDFHDGGDDETYETPPPGSFGASPLRRMFCVLAGPLAMVGVGAIIAGPAAFDAALAPFPAIWSLFERPLEPIEITGLVAPIAHENGIAYAFALTVAFVGGLQLYPLSFMSGGMAILALVQTMHGRPLPLKLMEPLHFVSFSVAFAASAWRSSASHGEDGEL
jgi:membrane-associated protease RseP (regulator of RpoE activity)